MMRCAGKTAVVVCHTGSVGRALLGRFAAEGANVVEIKADAEDAAFADALSKAASADIALFVAAPSAATSILEADLADFDQSVSRGVVSLFGVLRSVLPEMMQRGEGRVVVTCSNRALKGAAGDALGVGGDHAILGLVRAAAMDVAAHGVTVNAVCHRPEHLEASDFGDFADAVAEAAAFLCSAEARSITGGHFVVDAADSGGVAGRS